jgi:hypothetical protein
MSSLIGGDFHVIGPGVHSVERSLGQGQEMLLLINVKVGLGTHENR